MKLDCGGCYFVAETKEDIKRAIIRNYVRDTRDLSKFICCYDYYKKIDSMFHQDYTKEDAQKLIDEIKRTGYPLNGIAIDLIDMLYWYAKWGVKGKKEHFVFWFMNNAI